MDGQLSGHCCKWLETGKEFQSIVSPSFVCNCQLCVCVCVCVSVLQQISANAACLSYIGKLYTVYTDPW